ncbi:MAG: MFS transporter [Candidatus Dormibacteraeota bacterium]|nr:MFS transporter [Candidatus Dormibacteraeota bacterium]
MSADTTPAPNAASPGFRYLLGQRDFRLIWFAQVAAQLADKFLMFSLIILAYHVSNADTAVAVTLLAYTVPAVAVSPLAGVFADRHNRKVIMVVTNLARAALVSLIPLAAFVPAVSNDFLHLLVITFAFAAVGQLFSPAEAAAIPSVIKRESLMTANSLVMSTMMLTFVLGGALAPIVSRFSLYAPYWIAVGLFLVAGFLIWFAHIRSPNGGGRHVERHPFMKLALDLKEGWATLHSSPVILFSFCQVTLAVLVMFMLFTLAPGYVSHVLGVTAEDTYIILVPATIGCITSAGLLGFVGRRLSPWALATTVLALTGLTLFALTAVPTALRQVPGLDGSARWVGTAFALLLGIEFGALMIPPLSYLMEHTTDAVRGRVFALLFTVVNGVTALPVLLAAALSDLLGTSRVIATLGVLLALMAIGAGSVGGRVFRVARPDEP